MSDRKFFITDITIRVLSEDAPYQFNSISGLAYDVTDGDCVGDIRDEASQEVTAEAMIAALEAAGSDPSFFDLDEEGEV